MKPQIESANQKECDYSMLETNFFHSGELKNKKLFRTFRIWSNFKPQKNGQLGNFLDDKNEEEIIAMIILLFLVVRVNFWKKSLSVKSFENRLVFTDHLVRSDSNGAI